MTSLYRQLNEPSQTQYQLIYFNISMTMNRIWCKFLIIIILKVFCFKRKLTQKQLQLPSFTISHLQASVQQVCLFHFSQCHVTVHVVDSSSHNFLETLDRKRKLYCLPKACREWNILDATAVTGQLPTVPEDLAISALYYVSADKYSPSYVDIVHSTLPKDPEKNILVEGNSITVLPRGNLKSAIGSRKTQSKFDILSFQWVMTKVLVCNETHDPTWCTLQIMHVLKTLVKSIFTQTLLLKQ